MTSLIRRVAVGWLLAGTWFLGACSADAAIVVATGRLKAAPGNDVVVPISLKGVKDTKGVTCMSIRLVYDPAILTFKSLDKGPVLPNAMIDKGIDESANPGKLALCFVCGSKTPGSKEMAIVEEDGVVLNVLFTVNDKAAIGQKSMLILNAARLVDSADPPFELAVTPEEGEVAVIADAVTTGTSLPWMWILVGVGGALFLLLLIVLGGRGKKEKPSATEVPSFAPEGMALFSHTCVQCGGMIQLPTTMKGKSFQCSACGKTQIAGA